jgi:hypothetical protein
MISSSGYIWAGWLSRDMCYAVRMDWLRWHFAQHKTVIFAAVCVIVFFLVAFILFPVQMQQNTTAAGFGPDWECTAQGQGGPTCVKKTKP